VIQEIIKAAAVRAQTTRKAVRLDRIPVVASSRVVTRRGVTGFKVTIF
jgi:hypothetical protein